MWTVHPALAVLERGVKGLLVVIDLVFRPDGGWCRGAISGLVSPLSLRWDSVSADPSDSRRRVDRVGLLRPFPRSEPGAADSERVRCRLPLPPARRCCKSCCCLRCCCCC